MARPTAKGLGQLSTKHQLIDKANSYLIISSAVATVVVVFSIFASLQIIQKISYQNQVIGYREEARDQLNDNLDAIKQLNASYSAFEDTPESIIGTSDKNSKIVLDALPSKYDFPAFATSLDYIIRNAGMQIDGISGDDEELTAIESDLNPTAIDIPFQISANGNYEGVQRLIKDLERSIRPFKIGTMEITGEGDNLKVSITGVSYYQPSKDIGIEEQVVKSNKPLTTTAQDQQNDSAGTEQ